MSLGIVLALAGIVSFAFGIAEAWRGMPFSDDRWLQLPVGMMLSSFGIYFVLPDEAQRSRAVLGALVATGLALCFDWVAFGPGERRFTAGASASGAAVHAPISAGLGRFVFGIGALLLDAAAAWFWIIVFRMRG